MAQRLPPLEVANRVNAANDLFKKKILDIAKKMAVLIDEISPDFKDGLKTLADPFMASIVSFDRSINVVWQYWPDVPSGDLFYNTKKHLEAAIPFLTRVKIVHLGKPIGLSIGIIIRLVEDAIKFTADPFGVKAEGKILHQIDGAQNLFV